jgi:hypothetical protein
MSFLTPRRGTLSVTPGCTWRVHGHMPHTESNFIAAIVEPHTCLLQSSLNKHRNMTATFVANKMYGEVVEKVGMSPFRIMLAIQNRFGYEISYDMSWPWKRGSVPTKTHIITYQLF